MSEDKEKFGDAEFLSRWSRLKREAREQSAVKPQAVAPADDPESPLPELPPLDKLTIDSDFRVFFHPKVDETLRRAALKTLFSDPHFNVMDGLDTYIDDYSKSDPLPASMLAGLRQAQKILEWAKETEEETAAKRAEASTEKITPSVADQAAPPAVTIEPSSVAQSQELCPAPSVPVEPKS